MEKETKIILTKEQIESNKDEFLKLISEINIEGADTAGLVNFLIEHDFFTAPASTVYHLSTDGGLCLHSLNVYKTLQFLSDTYFPGRYDKSSLLAVGLLHDISKVDFYEKTVINKKKYNEQGTKHDNLGKFDWFSEDAFRVKEPQNRFLAGSHEENSMLLVSQYIPLTMEETVAILHHHCNSNDGNQLLDLSNILNRYPLLSLLHMADFLSTFVLEIEPK